MISPAEYRRGVGHARDLLPIEVEQIDARSRGHLHRPAWGDPAAPSFIRLKLRPAADILRSPTWMGARAVRTADSRLDYSGTFLGHERDCKVVLSGGNNWS